METATERQHASGASSLAALSSAAVGVTSDSGGGRWGWTLCQLLLIPMNQLCILLKPFKVDANAHFLLTNF